jgi:hypothetical protein
MYVSWLELFNINDNKLFHYDDNYFFTLLSQDVSSLLSYHYNFGINFNPVYQRDFVWSEKDQLTLIDSIFNNIEIGKFALIFNGYEKKPIHEILDGKQRLLTLIKFYEDKLIWNGYKFGELSKGDRDHFYYYNVSVLITKYKMSLADRLKYFLKLNVCGVAQDPEHIAKVREMLKLI